MKIECKDDKRVQGKRFYTAEPSLFPIPIHPYNYAPPPWKEMEEWCIENLGINEVTWNRWPSPSDRWFMNDAKFWFRDQQDMMMFVLRFS
jgi:hypothetical protein